MGCPDTKATLAGARSSPVSDVVNRRVGLGAGERGDGGHAGQTVAQKLPTARPRLLSTGTKGKEVRSPPGSRSCGRAVYCSFILQSCVAYKGMLKS